MKLRAVIGRITYQNAENGYSILKARVKSYDDLVNVGTVLVAEDKFGSDTFNITEKDCKRLGEVDGIGPKRIKKIHDSWMKQLDMDRLRNKGKVIELKKTDIVRR